jgi:hypothetical protein
MRTEGISELIIKVDDIERVADSYRDTVGPTRNETAPDGTPWFWTGEPGHSARIVVNNGRVSLVGALPFEEHSPIPEQEPWKKAYSAFQVSDGQRDAAIEDLRAKEMSVFGPPTLEWMNARACYFWDPDVHLVEFWSLLVTTEAAVP